MSNKLIVDLLQEVRKDQKAQGTILIKMQRDVASNKEGLAEHMEQTKVVKKLVSDNKADANTRFERLEKPYVVGTYVKSITLGVAGLVGSVWGIVKAVAYFNS